MNTIVERLLGVQAMTDQVIAMDMLITAKSGVRNYALAVTETADPKIRDVLTAQLEDAIDFHEQISAYVIDQGWYYPWDVSRQLELDRRNIGTALQLAGVPESGGA